MYRKDGWYGEGYLIETCYTDGRVWFGTKKQAIKSFCNQYSLNAKDFEWMLWNEKKKDFVKVNV